MPINYKSYPPNWKTEIRPAILERDGNKCKFCKAPNGEYVFRGVYDGCEVFQTVDGNVYHYPTGEFWEQNCNANIQPIYGDPNQKAVKIVLTIMHLDHDINNNDYDNLAAGCQKCHLNFDKNFHKANSRKTIEKKKGLQKLF